MSKILKEEAINEITEILNNVVKIQKLVKSFGIYWHSDSWYATDNYDYDYDYEDILTWSKENFKIIDVSKITTFWIGGSISCAEYEYEEEFVAEPEFLAIAKGNTVKYYLESFLKSYGDGKYFKLKCYDNGLEKNCGWEHSIGIKAIIKENAINNYDKTKKLIKKIKNESDGVIETSGSPITKLKENENYFNDSKLQPQGNFAYMVEFFSFNLVNEEEPQYIGNFGVNDKYIRDAIKLIAQIEQKAEQLRNKYKEEGVKVTVNGFNEGCQYGLALYVWIPYQ